MYVRQGQHAVVIGAGIAGLLAARVLSDHYAHVTVLERDDLVQTEAPRAGVPQGHHVHGLLARGAAIFEEFFPGLRQDLRQAGAPLGDFGDTVAFRFPEGWSPRTTLGISLQTFTRPLLESRLHHRVASLPTVTFRPGTSVVGLTGSATRVTGIRTRPRLGTAPHEYIVDADLVVDASGRSSRMPEWLQALGLPRPRETVIDAHLGYATRIYKIPEQVYCPWNAATEPLQPPPRHGDSWPPSSNKTGYW